MVIGMSKTIRRTPSDKLTTCTCLPPAYPPALPPKGRAESTIEAFKGRLLE